MEPNTHEVKIGVLLNGFVQFLDTACVDIFSTGSKEYLTYIVGKHVGDLAPSVTINYIAPRDTVTANTVDAIEVLSASVKILCTHGLKDAGVQPGELDILLIPGPDPRINFSETLLGFVRGHFNEPKTDVISICAGIVVCGLAGIIDGKEACGPRAMQPLLREKFPKVKFVGDEYRWKQDGKFWSGGNFVPWSSCARICHGMVD